MREDLERYVKNTADIRELSTPQLSGIASSQDYSEVLRKNFIRIGLLANEDREILKKHLIPYLDEDRRLSKEEMEILGDFGDSLLDAYELDNLDPSILLLLTGKLLSEAELIGDDAGIIEQLDREMTACYTLVNQTARIFPCPDIAEVFRIRGFAAAEKLLAYLDHEKFKRLPKESRELLMINARYMAVLFERKKLSKEECEKNFKMLEMALNLAKDPFFLTEMPDYNWKNHIFRTFQYMAFAVDHNNYRGFPPEILEKIADHLEEMGSMWDGDRAYFETLATEEEIRLLLVRGRYLSGRISRTEYFEELISIYEKRDRGNYELSGMQLNLNIPTEYLMALKGSKLSEKQLYHIHCFYRDILYYAFRMPNTASLGYMLEDISAVLEAFVEIPGEMTFRDMCLQCMAALHPPTYVHSLMVGQLTECLCRHLLKKDPGLFSNLRKEKSDDEILAFSYNSALCHDFGKILTIDTIFIYGRRLLDMEFGFIKKHPEIGANMLMRYPSTMEFSSAAMGHHRWYDGSGGYPEGGNSDALGEKVIIDLVTCADCIDAATDTVGRSYNKGKGLDDVIAEFQEGAGERYAPYLITLLSDKDVKDDLSYLLETGRSDNYKNTYLLLREIQERSGF